MIGDIKIIDGIECVEVTKEEYIAWLEGALDYLAKAAEILPQAINNQL